MGSYVESHKNLTVINNIDPITHEYIPLGPTINLQGTQNHLFLYMGVVLNKRKIIHLLEPEQIIRKLNHYFKK